VRQRRSGVLIAVRLLTGGFLLAGATQAVAQNNSPTPAQVVALDECDRATFNAALGPAFCHNVTLGTFTTLSDLFAKAAAGTPDPNWDFEPDTLHIKKGTPIIVVDQGGEPHTFTEVKQFGGGFIPALNSGGGNGFRMFRRVLEHRGSQDSHPARQPAAVSGLSKGEHLFQCCIHPWIAVHIDSRELFTLRREASRVFLIHRNRFASALYSSRDSRSLTVPSCADSAGNVDARDLSIATLGQRYAYDSSIRCATFAPEFHAERRVEMRALRFHQFGSFDNLKIETLPNPQPKSDEVVVGIRAASLNPSDAKNVLGRMEGTGPAAHSRARLRWCCGERAVTNDRRGGVGHRRRRRLHS
jgi:plastocyanin